MDAAAVAQALSFTGEERVEAVRGEGSLEIAVAHEAEASRCPPVHEEGGLSIFLDGYITGIEGTSFDPARPADALALCAGLYRREGTDFARRLNGSFNLAIHDREEGAVHLVCDRLASRHFYYMREGGALAFASRIEAFLPMGLDPMRRVDRGAFVEFLVFSRPLVSNLWEDVRSVPPATALSFRDGREERRVYWELRFTYEREGSSLDKNAERLAASLHDALDRATAGYAHVGLLLSGGIDSRALLACLPADTVCYTVCGTANVESRIAAKACELRGCRHVALRRGPNHYLEIMPRAARVAEGVYKYYDAHLENLYLPLREKTGGVILHGYGFNIILRGSGMNRVTWNIGGRSLRPPVPKHYRGPEGFSRDILRANEVSMEAETVLAPDLRREFDSRLRQTVDSLIHACSPSLAKPVDLFTLYWMREVRTCSDINFLFSLRQNVNERCVVLDNQILETILATPPEHRFESRLLKRALEMLDRRLARLVDANTLLPACWGPWLSGLGRHKRLYDRWRYSVARRTYRRNDAPWTGTSGSWDDIARLWKYSPLSGRLDRLLSDEAAMRDGVIDPGAARALIAEHRMGVRYHPTLLTLLVTFLEWRKATSIAYGR